MGEEKANMVSAVKIVLEKLLRDRSLLHTMPEFGFRGLRPFASGIPGLDHRLGGGFPRGQVSEIFGPPSSGRTTIAIGAARAATEQGLCVAWVDTNDCLDPGSAHAAGVTLSRLLWIRGSGSCAETLKALGIILSAGLFELVIWDLIGTPLQAIRSLPGATWLRLQRMIEQTPVALLLLAEHHGFRGPGGRAVALRPAEALWSAHGGSGRFLRGATCRAACGKPEDVRFELGGAGL